MLAWLAAAWQWHDTWLANPALEVIYFLPPLVFPVVAIVHYLRYFIGRRPVEFEVRDGAFVAPPAYQVLAGMAMTLLAGGTVSAGFFLWPPSTDVPQHLLVFGRITVVGVLFAWLLLIVAFARGTGRILMRPEGLRVTYAYGTRDIPWDAISAGPSRSAAVVEPTVRIGRPDLVRSTGLARRHPGKAFLPAGHAWIRREFLLDAINYYLATPAARDTIGTSEGYTHLRRVLRAD
ncbi:hypothetical protein GCM10010532_016010 [Dactylosporangium siamense]|uniref:PH domain-containing protein n=1 Tax=Dactylosporangium siamense TaxID=685454 RepID=A0A919U8U4_9ACTN|nr:hypothetical protein Dsi01nite_000390 [Dactylosporangium siamense]